MNKKSIAASAVAVLALAYVGTSFTLGKQFEERYNSEIDNFEPTLGPQRIISRSYDRGLFASTAVLVLEVSVPSTPTGTVGKQPAPPAKGQRSSPQPLRVTVENTVRHGPFPGARPATAVIETRVKAVEGMDDATRQAFAKATAPHVTIVIGLDGAATGRAVLPAGEITDPQWHARWQPLEYDFKVNAAATQMNGDARWPQLAVQGINSDSAVAPLYMGLEGLRVSFNVERTHDAHWLMAPGRADGTIDKLAFVFGGVPGSAPKPAFAMHDLKFASETTRDGALLDMTQSLTGHGTLGTTPIESVKFEMALKNIDGQALAELQGLSQAAPADGNIPIAALQQTVGRLLAAKPGYRVRVSASFEEQTGELGWHLELHDAPAGQAATPTHLPIQLMMVAVLQRVGGGAALRLPKAWLPAIARGIGSSEVTPQSVAATIDGLSTQGLLVENDQAYVADVKFDAGQLLLNGKPFTGLAVRR